MVKYKGIIFDFNGVLLWDAPLHEQVWQATAVQPRDAELSEDEFAIHVHGRTDTHILNYLTGRALSGKELLDLALPGKSNACRGCTLQVIGQEYSMSCSLPA
jgi:beta-phosphoglucomutase-like phosphatase (HAD superfamily)